MNGRHAELRQLMAALGHSSRYRIAICLLEGERCVGELAMAIGLSQSCTTRHVQALERAGFVRSRRDGKRVLVGIERGRAGIAELVGWLTAEPAAPAERRAPRRAARARAVRRDPQELPPAGPPASATHPAPAEAVSEERRRPFQAIEDFLL